MEHAEKIENAFVDYLSGLSVWTAGLLILAGENNIDKNAARIVAYVANLGEEYPPISGNRISNVVVELRTPFSKLTAKQVADGDEEPLDKHKANAAALQNAMMESTIAAELSTANTLTVMGFTDREPFREQTESYWSSGWTVKVYSCPS